MRIGSVGMTMTTMMMTMLKMTIMMVVLSVDSGDARIGNIECRLFGRLFISIYVHI